MTISMILQINYHGNCYSPMVPGVGDRWFLFVCTKEETSLQVMWDIHVDQDGVAIYEWLY